MFIQECESQNGIIFSFNVYTVSLQFTLVAYFRLELDILGGGQLLEGGKT